MAQPKTRRIAVLGFRAVGKSSLTIQYVENHFVDSYYPTIENTFTKVIKYKGQEFVTEIIDTAGHDEYSVLSGKHAVGIHGYILVYSIAAKSSFENCKVIRDKILDSTGTNWVPIVLVGNKCDLEQQRMVLKPDRWWVVRSYSQIPTETGQKLAQEWKCAFREASAKANININEIFDDVINEIEKAANPQPQNQNDCVIL